MKQLTSNPIISRLCSKRSTPLNFTLAIGIGTALGSAYDNLPVGLAIGIIIGFVLDRFQPKGR